VNAGDTSGSGLSPAVAALAGTKHVATLQKHLAQLRGAYDHGNRKLFYDELATAYLLAFSNPTLRSLRAIEDAGRLDAAPLDAAPLDAAPLDAAPLDAAGHPRHLRKLCRSTMSDAAALFDARLLVPLVRRLRAAVPDLRRRDGQLAKLLEHVQLVDGSLFASAADVAWARCATAPGAARRGCTCGSTTRPCCPCACRSGARGKAKRRWRARRSSRGRST